MNVLWYLVNILLLTTVGLFTLSLPTPNTPHAPQLHIAFVPDSADAYATQTPDTISPLLPVDTTTHTPKNIPTPTPSLPQVASPRVGHETLPAKKSVVPDASVEHAQSGISALQIFALTNQARAEHGLAPLLLDAKLALMAQAKLGNMIQFDYFAHTSPTGVTLRDLARQIGYRYVLIGENLAYGTFSDAQAIVDAWMNSPGHRANILHARYTHIGIAVVRAQFQGIEAWVAVQEFGVPASQCPEPERDILSRIEIGEQELTTLRLRLDESEASLREIPSGSALYAQRASSYNAAVEEYRSLVTKHNTLVVQYNTALEQYQTCIARFIAD